MFVPYVILMKRAQFFDNSGFPNIPFSLGHAPINIHMYTHACTHIHMRHIHIHIRIPACTHTHIHPPPPHTHTGDTHTYTCARTRTHIQVNITIQDNKTLQITMSTSRSPRKFIPAKFSIKNFAFFWHRESLCLRKFVSLKYLIISP